MAVHEIFWKHAKLDSFITKTVGVQALFDVARKLSSRAVAEKDVSVIYFQERLVDAKGSDFSLAAFRNASGSGRTLIRRFIELKIGLLDVATLAEGDPLKLVI